MDHNSNNAWSAGLKLNELVNQLQQCYQLTTAGKFTEATERLQRIAQCIPLLHVDTKPDLTEAQQLLAIAKEYLLGLQMETARKGESSCLVNILTDISRDSSNTDYAE